MRIVDQEQLRSDFRTGFLGSWVLVSLGCSCLTPIEQMAGLLGFPALSVPGHGLQFAGALSRRWSLVLYQTS